MAVFGNVGPGSSSRVIQTGTNCLPRDLYPQSGQRPSAAPTNPASALADNFDDNAKDATLWGADDAWRLSGDDAVGVTIAETNSRTEITGPSGVAGNHMAGRVSLGLWSLTDSQIAVAISSNTGTIVESAEDAYISFGADPANHYFVVIRKASGVIQLILGYTLAGSITTLQSVNTASASIPPWFRLRHSTSLNQILLDTATSGASNPPISGDWTNQASGAPVAGLPTGSGYVAFGAGTWGSPPTATTFYFDGFNTAATVSGGSITATASPALGSFTTTSTAKVLVKAAAAPALASFSLSSVTKVKVKASASPALTTFISASAAKALVHGLGSGTLNAFTATGVAKVKVKASASPSLANFTGSATAAVKVKAAASITPNAFTSAAADRILVKGAGSGILSSFGTTSTARVKVKAAAAQTLGLFTTTAVADVISANINAAASITLSPFISAAAAKALVEGIGSGTLNPFTASATAKVKVKAAASLQLDGFVSAASARIRIKASAVLNWGPLTSSGGAGVLVPASVPANRTTYEPALNRTTSAEPGLRTTYAQKRAAA